MELKGGSSCQSITTIQGIGKDWHGLPHRDPLYVKRLRERRKEQGGFYEAHRAVECGPSEKPGDGEEAVNRETGFEITV